MCQQVIQLGPTQPPLSPSSYSMIQIGSALHYLQLPRKPAGVAVLRRWAHKSRNNLPPDFFSPILVGSAAQPCLHTCMQILGPSPSSHACSLTFTWAGGQWAVLFSPAQISHVGGYFGQIQTHLPVFLLQTTPSQSPCLPASAMAQTVEVPNCPSLHVKNDLRIRIPVSSGCFFFL